MSFDLGDLVYLLEPDYNSGEWSRTGIEGYSVCKVVRCTGSDRYDLEIISSTHADYKFGDRYTGVPSIRLEPYKVDVDIVETPIN